MSRKLAVQLRLHSMTIDLFGVLCSREQVRLARIEEMGGIVWMIVPGMVDQMLGVPPTSVWKYELIQLKVDNDLL